jgi:sugar phosphate isomerase/epimerase
VATHSALKLSIQLASLRMPFPQALNLAAELGADAVEIDARGEINPQDLSRTGLREVRKMLADRRLRVAAVALRTRHGYATPEDLDRRIAATKSAMELASQLAAPLVLNSIGPIPPDDDAGGRQLLREVLDDLGRFGSRVGAILVAETGNESGSRLAQLLAELPEQCLGVDFNPGKLMAGGFSPLEAVAALGRWIRHVQATDARRGDPVALGRGDADFPALLAALDEHGYQGHFAIGCAGAGDPRSELADAIAQFRKYAGYD